MEIEKLDKTGVSDDELPFGLSRDKILGSKEDEKWKNMQIVLLFQC